MKSGKFVETVSNKFNWNEGLTTIGNTLTGIFGKPEQHVTYVTQPAADGDKDKDNTMLYVGLGGGALLLVILLIVFLR